MDRVARGGSEEAEYFQAVRAVWACLRVDRHLMAPWFEVQEMLLLALLQWAKLDLLALESP